MEQNSSNSISAESPLSILDNVDNELPAEANDGEQTALLARFPYSMVLKVAYSEPRDVLASERTCLAFIQFSTTLFFAALGIVLNFKINSSGEIDLRPGKFTLSSETVGCVLLVFSGLILVVSAINYMTAIKKFANNHVKVNSYTNTFTISTITAIVIGLFSINIALIIEGFIQ